MGITLPQLGLAGPRCRKGELLELVVEHLQSVDKTGAHHTLADLDMSF